jgi:hypothetical protein
VNKKEFLKKVAKMENKARLIEAEALFDFVEEIKDNKTIEYNKTKVEKMLEREIVRNSEILQLHRKEISKLKKQVAKASKYIDSPQTVTPTKKFKYLKELFEDMVNVIDQEFVLEHLTIETKDRVDIIRNEYEKLMKGEIKYD